jgi:hypothetical protein
MHSYAERTRRSGGAVTRSLIRSLAVAGMLFAPAVLQAVDFSAYHDLSEVEARLKAWSRNPAARLSTIGVSAGGRPIHLLRLAAGDGADDRPAVFVGANVSGSHNVGTEAALDLIETLLAGEGHPLLRTRTFYIAPVLNPDAHDALFSKVRRERRGNSMGVDRDADGLVAEDDFNDLDGDGRITWMRITDPRGEWLALPGDPRVSVRADALKGRVGAFRLEREGSDDDRDGRYNEDPREGVVVDMNFPKAFPYPKREAGPWPTFAPESLALVRFFEERPNIALAFIYGPANNLLDAPKPIEAGADLGTQRFSVPADVAKQIGLDPNGRYTLDEVWEVAKDLPVVVQNNLTKEQVGQFLGAGPATKVEENDQKLFDLIAKDYKERLKGGGVDADRPAEQYSKGGLTPWLYYQQGLLALELDVWGFPKKSESKPEEKKGDAPLTIERLDAMTTEEFTALPEATVAKFLQDIKAPAQFTAAAVIGRVKSGETTPKQIAATARQLGGSTPAASGEEDAATKRTVDTLAWIDANAPEAFVQWKSVTLPDGKKAEVGGVDPSFVPPVAVLAPSMKAHNALVTDLASKTARVEIASLEVDDLGAGVWRVRAVGANRGSLPTHTAMAARTKSRLPVRMRIQTGGGVELVTGSNLATAERLDAHSGTISGEWLVRAERGAAITVELLTQNAGSDRRSVNAGREN